MAKLVSKKLSRKRSAIGTIIVSHSDLEGIPRYSYLGTENFVIDNESNYDNQVKDDTLTDEMYITALTPWLDVNSYSVPLRATFTTKSGIDFICAERKTIKTWQTTWDLINQSQSSLDTFYADGGWNGFKYLTVPIVQGVEKEVTLGESSGEGAQSFLIATLDIEAADTYYTKQFCYIDVYDKGVEEPVVWTEVQHLQTATSTDKVFEINILDDLSGTEIKFGDGICGAIPSKDATLVFHYLETKGEDGNIADLYQFANEINFPAGEALPTNTKYQGLTIGCQNMWPIIGGENLENLAAFKQNAETAYAKNYDILHTYTELEEEINSISPIPLIKVRTATYYQPTIINSTRVLKNVIGITGLSTSLSPLSDLEVSIFEKVINETINSRVLSNKTIVYSKPSIVEIDSKLEIELKKPILGVSDFEENLSKNLQSILGKVALDSIDCYMQSDIIRYALEYDDNIGAIQATNLFTVATTTFTYGTLVDANKKYIMFEFKIPELKQNALSREGYCDRSLVDGNEIYLVFNLTVAGTKSTFIVQENSDKSTIGTLNYEKNSERFALDDEVVIPIYTGKAFTIKQLLKEKHAFTRNELSDASLLQTALTQNFSDVYFYVERSALLPKYYLMVDAKSIAEQLDFYDPENTDIKKIYTALYNSLNNGFSRATVSFEPVDKTVTGNWDTVMYYNNIDVQVD